MSLRGPFSTATCLVVFGMETVAEIGKERIEAGVGIVRGLLHLIWECLPTQDLQLGVSLLGRVGLTTLHTCRCWVLLCLEHFLLRSILADRVMYLTLLGCLLLLRVRMLTIQSRDRNIIILRPSRKMLDVK